ncbi:MAG TPA: response regulator [Candidatus Angelobacter sp.]
MRQSELERRGPTGVCRCSSNDNHDAVPTVLCVDDNAAFLSAFAAVLEKAGFAVTTASDPAEGLALVKRRAFDLAILDYHMPGMTGVQLARKIRRSRPRMPMLLLSANDCVPAAELLVFNRYVAKGENVQAVLLAIQSSIAGRGRKAA